MKKGTRHLSRGHRGGWAYVATIALCALALATVLHSEVWNDPGGISVDNSSDTIDFPRAMGSVVVFNDDTTNSLHVRIFECGETAAAATTNNLEIKPEKFESFNHGSRTEIGLGYCHLTVICSAVGPCPGRVHAK